MIITQTANNTRLYLWLWCTCTDVQYLTVESLMSVNTGLHQVFDRESLFLQNELKLGCQRESSTMTTDETNSCNLTMCV